MTETVWIAEAFENEVPTKRIVHTTEADAWEDIETCEPNADRYSVVEEKVHRGKDAIKE